MGVKFSQFWKNAPLTFCLVVALDPRLKFVGVVTLLNAKNNNMNQNNVNDILMIKTYWNNFI